jgi:hypothetical protein
MMDHLTKVHGFTEAEYTARHPGAAVRVAGTAQKRGATVGARYGVTNVFQADGVKAKSRATMVAHHGAPTALQSPAIRQRVAETNLQRYGHANPFGSPEVQAKIRQTNLATYGMETSGGAPAVVARRIESNLLKYGSPVPQGFGLTEQTLPEKIVAKLAPACVYYSGDRSYWVRTRGSDGVWKNRNPDFVVYTDPERLAQVQAGAPLNEVRTNKIIEVLGDYWHREELVGLPRDAYVSARKAEYDAIGIACLILWESEVKTDPDGVRERLAGFCG